MARSEKLIKVVPKDGCARPNNDDIGSTEDSNKESNKAREIATGNKEACIGNVRSCMTSVDNCEDLNKSTRAGGMFGFKLFYKIGGDLACKITNAIVVCPMNFCVFVRESPI
jgi:hypothetical protein